MLLIAHLYGITNFHHTRFFVSFLIQAIELLVEKSLSSGPCPGGPGEALRRVLEVLSSGLFLPGTMFCCLCLSF